jgi:hypothetical protein
MGTELVFKVWTVQLYDICGSARDGHRVGCIFRRIPSHTTMHIASSSGMALRWRKIRYVGLGLRIGSSRNA